MVKITFPDGNTKEFEQVVTAYDVSMSISEGLTRQAICCKIDGQLSDMTTTITKDCKFEILTSKHDEALEVMRHSAAHILAEAVINLFPYAKPTIGPVVEDGFYYDFDHKPFTPEDLEKIEAEMKRIIKEKGKFQRIEYTAQEAKDAFKDNQYKIELVEEYQDQQLSVYKSGKFEDLCRGPHIQHAGQIEAVKLTKLAGAYWRGDAKNTQLQRIYGIAFFKKAELNEYLVMRQEAEKRDHKKLGKQLKIFMMNEAGPGFPFYLPNGMVMWDELIAFWKKSHKMAGYVEVKTPIMLNRGLWETSGHWENYRENMYATKIDEQDFAIKPMNCPGGMLIYKEHMHSYRELPLRMGEVGLVHRHEMSGTLNGLFRVRMFHQDDAHIFMTDEQIESEILGVLDLADKMYSVFGLTYTLELSTRPDKSIGTDEQWDLATKGLQAALDKTGKEYLINEGDGAFYGPKIDIHIKDAIGRTWQCGTIQLDMSLPERFDLTYEAADGTKKRPIMIHRVIYGSIERFFGILIEHFAGKFPLWLNPRQVRILTIADRFNDYAETVKKQLEEQDIRVECDFRAETLNKKVREAQLDQFNYILVIGEKEVEAKTVNIRTRNNKVLGSKNVTEFAEMLKKEIKEKTL